MSFPQVSSGVQSPVHQYANRKQAPGAHGVRKTGGQRRGAKLAKGFDDLRSLIPCYPPEKKLTKIETLRLAILYIKDLSGIVGTSAVTVSPDVSLNESMSPISASDSSECKSICSTPADEGDNCDSYADSINGVRSPLSQSASPNLHPSSTEMIGDVFSRTPHCQTSLCSANVLSGGNSPFTGLSEGSVFDSSHQSVSGPCGQSRCLAGNLTNVQNAPEKASSEPMSAQQFLLFLQQQALTNAFSSVPTPTPLSPLPHPLPFSSFDNQWPCGVFA